MLDGHSHVHAKRLARSLLVTLILAVPAVAYAHGPEHVVALVDGDPIWLSEVRDLARLRHCNEREALDTVIDRRLVEHAVQAQGIAVPDARVDAAIANLLRVSDLDEAEFWQSVGQAGFTRTEYRERLRRELARLDFLGNDGRDLVRGLRRRATIVIRL